MRRLALGLVLLLVASVCSAGGAIHEPLYGRARVDWQHPLSRGLVGYWLTNEGGGDQLYDVARHHTGTLSNMEPDVDWTIDEGGQTLTLDGSNEWVEIDSTPELEPAHVSVVCRFRSDRAIQYEEIVRKGNNISTESYDFIRGYPSSGDLRFSVYVSGSWRAGPYTSINTAQWYVAVGTYDGATIRMYLDGVEVGTPVNYSGSAGAGGDPLALGRRWKNTGADRYFQGDLEYVRIYSRALLPAEIVALYQNPYAGLTVDRVWAFKAGAAAGGGLLFHLKEYSGLDGLGRGMQ